MKPVFQLLGNFHWPLDGKPNKHRQRGVIDIYYEPSGVDQVARLEFRPAGGGASVDLTGSDYSILGATLLICHNNDEPLPLQWPLVDEATIGARTIRSRLQVTAGTLSFELLLPSLIRQVAEPKPKDRFHVPNVLGLTVQFPRRCSADDLGRVNALDCPGPLSDPPNDNAFEVRDKKRETPNLFHLALAIRVDNNVDRAKFCWQGNSNRRKLQDRFPLGAANEQLAPFQLAGMSLNGISDQDIGTCGVNPDDPTGELQLPSQDEFCILFGARSYRQRLAFRALRNSDVTGDGLVLRKSQLIFRDRDNPWGWIAAGKPSDTGEHYVYFNLYCEWNLPDDPVAEWLSGRSIDQTMKARIEMLWPSEISEKNVSPPHAIAGLPVIDQGGLADLLRMLRKEPGESLLDVLAEQPQSSIPSVLSVTDNKVWFAAETTATQVEVPLGAEPTRQVAELFTPIRHVSLAAAEKLYPIDAVASGSSRLTLTAQLRNLQLNQGQALTIHLERAEADPAIDAFAGYQMLHGADADISMRIGALELTSAPAWLSEPGDAGTLSRVSLFGRPPAGEALTRHRIGARFDWRFNISSVRPVTVDIARGDRDRSDRPLLINETGDKDRPLGKRFGLHLVESIHPGTLDWTLRADLADATVAGAPNAQHYTVIAAEPFSLFRFSRLAFEESGDVDTARIAEYDSDTRQWRFLRRSPYYRYVFPAQAVGESSDKPRRLEIHDRDPAGPPRPEPFPPSANNAPERTYLVEWRLAPPTELWIRPVDFERNYFLPEWAAQDIFRQRNDFGLGAQLAGLRGEFLYGLTVSIDPALESGASRRARVAELEALTGRLPRAEVSLAREPITGAGIGAVQEQNELGNRWRVLRPLLKGRQERLELWADQPDQANRIAYASFAKGVKFALRTSALHRTPVNPPELPAASGTVTINPNSQLRHSSQGLPGGALWPLESWNAFHRLIDNPSSRGGRIERVALGPTGGDADQKAEFLNGILSIIAQTRAGYVQTQRVEVLGRIGALWHRAKHVIVYERTVNPSAQFAPEQGGETRTRRPVIRKVREYVEIIQPRRDYPDFGAPPRTAGFLRGVQFNSQQIAVDSAWGEDIGDFGYQIPLWNRHAATIRPQVYPMPDVAFLSAGDTDRPEALCAQECLEPENLYFVADFSSNDPDSDQWPSRLGIDTTRTLSPSELLKAMAATVPADVADAREERQSSASRLMPSMRRFTWRLGAGSGKTRVNEHRGNKPIYAAVDSITFLRAMPEAPPELPLAQIPAVLTEASKPIPIQAGYWNSGQSSPDSGDAIEAVADAHNTLLQALPEGQPPDLPAARAALSQLRNLLIGDPGSPALIDLAGQANRALQGIREKAQVFANRLASDAAPCDGTRSRILADLKRKRQLLEQNLRLVQHDLHQFLDQAIWTPALPDAAAFRARLAQTVSQSVNRQLELVFAQAHSLTARPREHVAQARSIVQDTERDLVSGLNRAKVRLDALARSYQDGKPWSENRLAAFDQKLTAEWRALIVERDAALDEAQQRLAVDIDASGRRVSAMLARVLDDASRRRLEIGAVGRDQSAILLSVLTEIQSAQAIVTRTLSNLETKLTTERNRPGVSPADLQRLDQMLQALPGLRDRTSVLGAEATRLAGIAHGNWSKLVTQVDATLVAIQNLVNEALQQIPVLTTALHELTSAVREEVQTESDALLASVETCKRISTGWGKKRLQQFGDWLDFGVDVYKQRLDRLLLNVASLVQDGLRELDAWLQGIDTTLNQAEDSLQRETVRVLNERILSPAFSALSRALPDTTINAAIANANHERAALIALLREDLDQAIARTLGRGGELDRLEAAAISLDSQVSDACEWLADARAAAWNEVRDFEQHIKARFKTLADKQLKEIADLIDAGRLEEAAQLASKLEAPLRTTVNQIAEAGEHARAMARRLLESAGNLGTGGAEAVPGNLLRLYAAATAPPELALLEANCDRIRCAFDEVEALVKTSGMQVHFQRLGDALKAMGLNLDVDGLSDQLKLNSEALAKISLGQFFKNFGGINLKGLLDGARLPKNVFEAIQVSHEFDRKRLRAWVQIDIDVPVPGRRELFAVGPFTLYFRDTRLSGRLHYAASADTTEISESGHSEIITSIEAVVGGQVMVTLQHVAIRYTAEQGLDIDFDPARIKLNDVFRFIQDTLGTLFPDEIGGLKLIKQDGIPIGVEHLFSLPPLSLSFGTSGVSNIQIINQFRLLAYPDFVIANRFNLSTVEQPFIFSIFILGGTGYIQIDTEYRPFDRQLMVVVEAAAGASAALAFALGPVQGAVYITLSVALTYRKLPKTSGALTVSLVLVIAGSVSLWGMVRIFLVLMLRLSYQGNGAIDAHGALSVEVRVSRWFKLRYRTDVKYRLRDGQSTTTRSESIEYEPDEKLKKLQDKANSLAKARGTA